MAKFILSAFADEIDPDPQKQVDMLKQCGVYHIELRSILNTNILDLTDVQVKELKSLLDKEGITLSALGSPIGKIPIDQPFEPHLERFKHALELCKLFGTRNMRIFSYYPPAGGTTDLAWRQEVMDRMGAKLKLARAANIRLVHENEHRIFGDDHRRVKDLMETFQEYVDSGHFGAVYDPANYVFCGFDPWEAWEMTHRWTVHFHIKDWKKGDEHGSLAGLGEGRIFDVMSDALKMDYTGFATLEPHLTGGGPTGGTTGPALFPKAVEAYTKILDQIGAAYE